jgi:hypothetical protein
LTARASNWHNRMQLNKKGRQKTPAYKHTIKNLNVYNLRMIAGLGLQSCLIIERQKSNENV